MALNIPRLLRKNIKLADTLTKSAQPEILFEAWESETGFGVKSYRAPKKYRVVLDLKQQERRDSSGRLILAVAYILFVQPVKPLGIAGRNEPIDMRDRITLPDGSQPAIVEISGFVDRDTESPYFHEVWLGSRIQSPQQ